MTPDDVITKRQEWDQWQWSEDLPAPTILATSDWLAYVAAMAAAIPAGHTLETPNAEDVRWAWPDGVTIVFDHAIEMRHVITSHQVEEGFFQDKPHTETQMIVGMAIGPTVLQRPTIVGESGELLVSPVDIAFRRVTYIGADPSDIVTGRLIFGYTWRASLDIVSASQRFLQALVVALGHRLSTYSVPSGPRAMQRRIERQLPGLRFLILTSGATTQSRGGTVEWSRRWIVRGHWRMQPCGPGRAGRKLKWIDPYIKGPDDKPLDVRPTVWKTSV